MEKHILSVPKVDNLIKLMSIQQRLKYGLPVILMGETGCGKTALVTWVISRGMQGWIKDVSLVITGFPLQVVADAPYPWR